MWNMKLLKRKGRKLMDIQSLVKEKVIGNIKTGIKGTNGLPQKLDYFHVEEDKATSKQMVDIFKQLYPNKTRNLRIRFVSENPFNFKFKRYVKGKVVCIGNGTKAITVGKNEKGQNAQIEICCNEDCEQRLKGTCKLVGSLRFVLDGIDAGGVWKLNTSGGFSLSNIATEIVNMQKRGESIVGKPFEISLTPQESMAYGTYYSINLRRLDIKPQLISTEKSKIIGIEAPKEDNNIIEISGQAEYRTIDDPKKKLSEKEKKIKKELIETMMEDEDDAKKEEVKQDKKEESQDKAKTDFSKFLAVKKYVPIMINNMQFYKIIFQDEHQQDVEYVLHPKANQDILTKYGVDSLVVLKKTQMEANHNILCEYEMIRAKDQKTGEMIEFQNGKPLKKAV